MQQTRVFTPGSNNSNRTSSVMFFKYSCMIRNYFLIALRNLWKNKVFSAINIFGLSTGLPCCILIFLFIQYELSYDKFHVESKNIYRVTSAFKGKPDMANLAVSPAPWAPLMKKDFPEIKNYVRLLKDEKASIGQPGEQHFYETKMLYADSTIFEVFSINLVVGDKQALDGPNTIVLTRKAAHKYFGNENPIGKTLEINSFGRNFVVEVSGIVEELPGNSHFNFNSLVSLRTLGDLSSLWSFHMFQSYLLLHPNVDAGALERKMPGFVQKYILNNPAADGDQRISLQSLTSIHLHSQMTGELEANSDITFVYVFAAVALFILLIACFNFTNLTTARSFARAKEVGLRKVVGANRKQLLAQFLSETSLFALIALALAIGIAYVCLPVFNQLSGRQLSIDLNSNNAFVVLLTLLVTGVGLVAGLYPAAVLSAFKPVEVLKGKFTRTGKGISFRKFLVTLQFVVSIALISCTILINKQHDFLQNTRLGFNKENILVVSLPRAADSARLESFKSTLMNSRGIVSVAASSSVPGTNIAVNQVNDGDIDLSKATSVQMLFTDQEFVRTMGMTLLAGRDFNNELATDKAEGFVINEEAVKSLGWQNAQKAVGQTMQWVQPGVVLKKGKVIGVLQNFNITPLRSAVQPLVIHYLPQRFQYLYIRFQQSKEADIVPLVEKAFNDRFEKQTFEYSFLDETLNSLYASERKLATIFSYFSFLAIVIACLGVLALSLYSIQQRLKEIGIRKVLGASVFSITRELLKEFLVPVFTAAVIATPLAWYAMNKWLEDFAYRININWIIFLMTTLIVLVLTVVTMSVQTIRAALSNPVRSLRTE